VDLGEPVAPGLFLFGTTFIVRTKLRPKGLPALLLPLMRRTMHEREDQNLDRVKAILEGTR
jgi:hypothetical protein